MLCHSSLSETRSCLLLHQSVCLKAFRLGGALFVCLGFFTPPMRDSNTQENYFTAFSWSLGYSHSPAARPPTPALAGRGQAGGSAVGRAYPHNSFFPPTPAEWCGLAPSEREREAERTIAGRGERGRRRYR